MINQPERVFVYPGFLKTLDKANYLSGYAEILKYSLIDNNIPAESINIENINDLIRKSIQVKNHFVNSDVYEQNIRKALNFGHNFGHAFEAVYAQKGEDLLHGFAVAASLICELYLSANRFHFPIEKHKKVLQHILHEYGKLDMKEGDRAYFFEALSQDKKNFDNKLIFTLINEKKEVQVNQECTMPEIEEALDFYLNYSE